MPIYEFYCSDCHTLFNFFAAAIDTSSRPACPRCERAALERRPARFATPGRGTDAEAGIEEGRIERAFAALAGDLDLASSSADPRSMAAAMRRLGDAAGLPIGPQMRQLLGRIEAGEDPQAIEAELDEIEDDDPAIEELLRTGEQGIGDVATRRPERRLEVDDELYFL